MLRCVLFYSVNQMERTESCTVRASGDRLGQWPAVFNKDTERNSKKVDLYGKGQIAAPR
jgi:hypothetical protein